MRKITKEKFIELYTSEMLVKDIADFLGCTRVTVRNWARKFNLPSKRKTYIEV